MKRIKPHSKAYKDLVMDIANDFCPLIEPCKECGAPVPDGYACPTCGEDPERAFNQGATLLEVLEWCNSKGGGEDD